MKSHRTRTSQAIILSALIGLVGVATGCPDSSDPVADTAGEVVADVADETDAAADTAPPECTTDSECTASGQCKVAACFNNKCVETNAANGADCSSSATCVATCDGGVCGTAAPEPTCAGRQCGEDGCGTSCGTCDAGVACDTATGYCEGSDPCSGVTFDGCCTAAGVAKWCELDDLGVSSLKETDCSDQYGVAHWCGWTTNLGFYCSETVAQNPEGLTLLCPGETCDETCGDAECGWVCGEECGTCGAGQFCDSTNSCVVDVCNQGDPDGVGCCATDLTAWCADEGPAVAYCGDSDCGWDPAEGWYNCGFTGADPSGTYPLECGGAVVEPQPEGAEAVEVVEAVDGPVEAVEPVEVAEPVDAGPTDVAETVETVGDADAGTSDAGTTDAGTTDAGTTDAGTTDAGTTDAGTTDAGTTDAGTTDAGTTDAGTPDAGTTDAGATDAGATDVETSDGGPVDAMDAGSIDAPSAGSDTTTSDASEG